MTLLKRIDNIVMIQLSGSDSNIYVVGDTVIDAGTGFNFVRLKDMFRALKMKLEDIKQVVNTHGHFDHMGGNGYFISAKVAIHEADSDILETANMEKSCADFFDGKLQPRKVDMKLKNGDKINTKLMELEVIHTPGHTPGSICLYNKKNGLLFTGDTIFAEGVGRVDLPGGSEEQLVQSMEKLKKLSVKKMLPGHGEPVLANPDKIIKTTKEMTEFH